MPMEECADQSEPTSAPRQVGVAELEQGRHTESIGMVETRAMHSEAARSRTYAHPEGLVSETVEFPPIDDQICDVNREGMFPVHEAYDSTNHTSHISNSLGSNEQDDGSDQEGSPGMVEEVSSESATRNRSVSARFGTSGDKPFPRRSGGVWVLYPVLQSRHKAKEVRETLMEHNPRRVQQSLSEQINGPAPGIPYRGSSGEQS